MMSCRIFALVSFSFSFMIAPMTAHSITAGWPALEREFQSAVLIWTIEDNKPKFLCSGVVIAPDTVATAASCVYTQTHVEKSTTLFISTALKIDFKIPLAHALQNVSAIAKKGIRHHEADLMLIFLKQPLSVDPALLLSPNETFQIRLLNQVILAGYGYPDIPTEPGQIRRIIEKLTGLEESVEPGEKLIAKTKIVYVSSKEFLVAKEPNDGTACNGDEGAPVFAHIDTPFNDSQRVLGVVSSSSQLPKCGQPSSVIRLDAYREFINEKMIQGCRNKDRSWCKTEGLLEPGYKEEYLLEPPAKAQEDSITQPKPATDDARMELPKEETAPAKEKATNQPIQRQNPQKTQPPATKPLKRRLSVAAEGAGCSCQQVFTTRP